MDAAPTQLHTKYNIIMYIYSPQCYPHCRLFIGGSRTQGIARSERPGGGPQYREIWEAENKEGSRAPGKTRENPRDPKGS